ncbi:unnamed protein product [Bursaphelenchus okinawaensis]|uniref:Uncharacterized protein n=1 Tax=Bursaphelenchus okinawaensis TaxID=465554 RepID=A0A811KR17_9BILA|nr:unnamed protein product [Bursaphelenchus okinawaensis]CAG9111132.1 unnamed protein product [Bursaphelenchus okinawaensis]
MSDRLYYQHGIYCYNKTEAFEIDGNITTKCADVLTGGVPMKFVGIAYDKMYGMPNQEYQPFANLILQNGTTYMYANGANISS